MYESLTKYLPDLEQAEDPKDWRSDHENATVTESPTQMPSTGYSRAVAELERAIYSFADAHPDFGLDRYNDILEENGIAWNMRSMSDADVSHFAGCPTMALLIGAVRAERFCSGALFEFLESGCIRRWLLRLQELDQ